MRLLTLDLKMKFITSKRTFDRSSCGMVVYKDLKSRIETDFVYS